MAGLSLRLILRRMRHRAPVLEHLAQITAINPAVTGWATDEVVGLTRGWLAETLPDVLAAGDHLPESSSASRFTASQAGSSS